MAANHNQTITSNNDHNHSSMTKLSLFGLSIYIVIIITFAIMVSITILSIVCCHYHQRRRRMLKGDKVLLPIINKEITESTTRSRSEKSDSIDHKKFGRLKIGYESVGTSLSGESRNSSSALSHEGLIGWGRWYSYKEVEIATGGFNSENVVGEGGYGVVYRGTMPDNSFIAIKNLFNNKEGEADQEFKVEVEAIGKVRHKNLVGLIGYCVEGSERMLIYEYVNNGNLEQWLRGNLGSSSPLTWDARMKIAIGTAKGLAYLHEGLEPKVVHRDIKSSNILLDKKWNPKVSDFGLAKLLSSESSHVTTRVMGTFGYVAPEYASSGRLNECSDVYSFGVLLIEIISARSPVDYARPAGEVKLVDWFRTMVGKRRGEEMLDPRMEIQASPRTLKRIFLVCLRCIDLDASKRPKMGQVVHMLEADEFPYRMEHLGGGRDSTPLSPHATPAEPDGKACEKQLQKVDDI
ncbi:hypothetical protein ACHQM5_017089 [Ranunculus cassubicifolius]